MLVKNVTAFASRHQGSGLPVLGSFTGTLDNSGERLTLLDEFNEEILDFSYSRSWYPVTDGLGFSLVVTSPSAEADSWGSRQQWRASAGIGGAPGQTDPTFDHSSSPGE